MLEPINLVEQQFSEVELRALDDRPRINSGWEEFDALLNRGGFAPGNLCCLVGRTHTRKTSVAVNFMANMMRNGVPVGLVGLDEQPVAQYILKLMSAISGFSAENIEEHWLDQDDIREEYRDVTEGLLTVAKGARPDKEDLSAWLDAATVGAKRPEVIFIDYISLMYRNKFDGAENQRLPRLFEELQVFASEEEVVVVGLHHVGKYDDSASIKNHGEIPLTLESLKFGGEDIADIVMGTFRPALDPLGNKTEDIARLVLRDKFDYDEWMDARLRVEKEKKNTYLQLLKNRPGTRLNYEGIRLCSIGESQKMVPASEMLDYQRKAS